jgi:tetratricopeptide (TPR) repeat protein
MRSRRTRVIPWLVLLALALPPVYAAAQDTGPAGRDHKAIPSGKYTGLCSEGNAKYALRDFPAAIAHYHAAIELDPKNPLGHYLLGEAQLAAGNVADAEASWNRASLESGERDPAMRSRVLFVIADLKERQWKWDDAKAAWQVYLDWASRFPNAAAYPASARSRQQVIDAMLRQDKSYEVVRRRIEETKDGGVFTDLSKAPSERAK